MKLLVMCLYPWIFHKHNEGYDRYMNGVYYFLKTASNSSHKDVRRGNEKEENDSSLLEEYQQTASIYDTIFHQYMMNIIITDTMTLKTTNYHTMVRRTAPKSSCTQYPSGGVFSGKKAQNTPRNTPRGIGGCPKLCSLILGPTANP